MIWCICVRSLHYLFIHAHAYIAHNCYLSAGKQNTFEHHLRTLHTSFSFFTCVCIIPKPISFTTSSWSTHSSTHTRFIFLFQVHHSSQNSRWLSANYRPSRSLPSPLGFHLHHSLLSFRTFIAHQNLLHSPA